MSLNVNHSYDSAMIQCHVWGLLPSVLVFSTSQNFPFYIWDFIDEKEQDIYIKWKQCTPTALFISFQRAAWDGGLGGGRLTSTCDSCLSQRQLNLRGGVRKARQRRSYFGKPRVQIAGNLNSSVPLTQPQGGAIYKSIWGKDKMRCPQQLFSCGARQGVGVNRWPLWHDPTHIRPCFSNPSLSPAPTCQSLLWNAFLLTHNHTLTAQDMNSKVLYLKWESHKTRRLTLTNKTGGLHCHLLVYVPGGTTRGIPTEPERCWCFLLFLQRRREPCPDENKSVMDRKNLVLCWGQLLYIKLNCCRHYTFNIMTYKYFILLQAAKYKNQTQKCTAKYPLSKRLLRVLHIEKTQTKRELGEC